MGIGQIQTDIIMWPNKHKQNKHTADVHNN